MKATLLYVLTVCILMACTVADAKRLMLEDTYVTMSCTGIQEYVNADKTRVDCLWPRYAAEYDFANKWAECIGQSLHYSRMTGVPPMCVLIIENTKDCKYLLRAQGLGVTVFTIDYSNLCPQEKLWKYVDPQERKNK